MLTAYGQLGLFNLESEEQQVIHGVLTGGHIKLVNCYSTNQRTTIGKFASTDETTWRCQFAFRGDEYCGDVPNRIKSVEADIELLGDWTPGFEGVQRAEDGLSLTWPASQPDQAARWDLGVVVVRQDIRSSWNFSRHAVESATVRNGLRNGDRPHGALGNLASEAFAPVAPAGGLQRIRQVQALAVLA